MSNVAKSPVLPGEWFTLEVTVSENHVIVKVDGQTTADYSDPERRFSRGRIALLAMNQEKDRQRFLEFRKIEIKELPAPIRDDKNSSRPGDAAANDKAMTIINHGSGKTIGVYNRATKDGSWVVQDQANQQWKLISADGEWSYIVNVNSGTCLAVAAGADRNGTQLVIFTKVDDHPSQLWKLVPVDGQDGYVKIVNKMSGRVVGVSGGSKKSGALLILWEDVDRAANQEWKVEKDETRP